MARTRNTFAVNRLEEEEARRVTHAALVRLMHALESIGASDTRHAFAYDSEHDTECVIKDAERMDRLAAFIETHATTKVCPSCGGKSWIVVGKGDPDKEADCFGNVWGNCPECEGTGIK